MADIVLNAVYDAAQRSFRTQGSGSERFESDFVDCARRAVSYINVNADPETRITLPTSTESTLTGLDAKYEYVLFSGITRFLMEAGQKPAKGFEKQLPHVVRQFESDVQGYQDDVRNIATEADSDDEVDIIGIGGLG